jgi:hypothetical protein
MENRESGHTPIYKGSLSEQWRSTLPDVRVGVIVRPPPLYLRHNGRQDTEPPPDPLVLRAEPEFTGDPGRKWQRTDLAEIVRQEIFIHRVRIDLVPGLPDPDNTGSTRFEDKKIVRKVRVFVCLPAVAHPFSELFGFVNGCGRFSPPGHFLMVGVGGLKGLWLEGMGLMPPYFPTSDE